MTTDRASHIRKGGKSLDYEQEALTALEAAHLGDDASLEVRKAALAEAQVWATLHLAYNAWCIHKDLQDMRLEQ